MMENNNYQTTITKCFGTGNSKGILDGSSYQREMNRKRRNKQAKLKGINLVYSEHPYSAS